ncbi:MAG: YbaK/EbsC family protein [bacterium]|nr:YbaK/EbsC family protein [bacterium]
MAIAKRLTNHLKKQKLTFDVVPHRTVYTAYDLAQTLGEKLDSIAKTLLVKVEFPKIQKKKPGYYVLAIPASYQADFGKVKKALSALKVELAPERVMKKLGVQPGAVVPFTSFHKIELLLDKSLAKLQKVIVRTGSYTDSLRIKVKDLHKLEQPKVGIFGKRFKKK